MTPEERFWAKVNRSAGPDGCWLWTACVNNKGYGKFWTGERLVYAHRYALGLVEIGHPGGVLGLHECDTPACVNVHPKHVGVGTQAKNLRDCVTRGRHAHGRMPGEANAMAKLTDEAVKEIRELAKTTPQVQLAARYGVTKQLVSRVVRREGWAHV